MTFVPETDHGVVVADVSTPSANRMEDSLQRINDAVYLAKKGVDEGRRGAQIVFIHGLQVQKNKDPFLETWLSADGRDLWPQSWLSDSFPTADIYLVRYDSCTWKDDRNGRMDMFVTAESLLHNLLQAKIGQNPRYPVILIGHDVGGLLIKEICLQAFFEASSASKEQMAHEKRLFLAQLKGVFYLSTPHGGLHHWDQGFQGELMRNLMVHNAATSRSNENFRKMRTEYKWSAFGLGASLPVRNDLSSALELLRLPPSHFQNMKDLIYHSVIYLQGKDRVLHVKEASERYDVDEYTMIGCASTTDICGPKDSKSLTFVCLEQFIQETLSGFTKRERVNLPFTSDPRYVPLKETEREIRQRLENPDTQVVVLYGDAGTGKSCVAKCLALQYEQEVKTGWNSEFRDGIFYLECGRGANAIKVLRKMLRDLQEDENVISTYYEDQNLMSNSARKQLKDLNVLLIFDDVWDEDRKEFLEKVVFPELAKEVKYLITSQQSDGWSGYSTCQIQTINHIIAKQIIAKHAGLGDDKIPEDYEDIVDMIIQATGLHPLALATVSNSLRLDAGGRALGRADWERLNQDLLLVLKQDTLERPSIFGEAYPRSVFEAIIYPVDRLLENKNDGRLLLHLMCIMTLFKGPFPASVVHLYMSCTQPQVSCRVRMLMARLRGCKLVQDAEQLVQRDVYTVPYVTTLELPFLKMHILLQQFILGCVASGSDSSSPSSDFVQVIRSTIAPFLCETNDGGSRELEHPDGDFHPKALSTALCALYGVAQVKRAARRNLCKYQAELKIPLWNVHCRSAKQWLRHYCLEVLMAGIEKHSSLADIQSTLQKVVWKYIFELQIDDDNLSFLISRGYDCALPFLTNHAVGLRFNERFEMTSSILRSLTAAVSWLKRFKGTDKDLNSRILTVLCLFQCLASTFWGSDPSAVVDAFDLEFLLNLLHREYDSNELAIPTVVIQILGTLGETDSKVELHLISLLEPRPVQDAIESIIEKIVADLNINGKFIFKISYHGSEEYSESGIPLHKVMVQLNTVVKAMNLLRHFSTFGDEKVVAIVTSISEFLEVIARLFQGNLAEYLCVIGLTTFRSIPCIKDQRGRSVTCSIPGAIEGVVSVVRRIERQPENRVMHYALDVLAYWTRSDGRIRSRLLSDPSFLELVVVRVIAEHMEEWHPLRQLSAVSLLETFVTSDDAAASQSVSDLASLPVHEVLSYLLARDPKRVLQRSALTRSDAAVTSRYRSSCAPFPEVHQVLPRLQVRDPIRVSQRSQLSVRNRTAESTSMEFSGPTVEQVLSVLARKSERDLQRSVMTVLLYLGYSIDMESCSSLQFVNPKRPQRGAETHALKVKNAFESLLGVILHNGQRVAQVAALELLVYLVRNHSSARARICDMPSAVTGLATLLQEDDPVVQELARQASRDLAFIPL